MRVKVIEREERAPRALASKTSIDEDDGLRGLNARRVSFSTAAKGGNRVCFDETGRKTKRKRKRCDKKTKSYQAPNNNTLFSHRSVYQLSHQNDSCEKLKDLHSFANAL